MKKAMKLLTFGSIIAPIGAAISCSNVPHQAPIPFGDKKPKLLEKESPVVPPETIMGGKFRHDPQRFDEIKEELGKVTSITENDNTITYHTSHTKWTFVKSDINNPKFSLLKNKDIVKRIIKECISSLNIMLWNTEIQLTIHKPSNHKGLTAQTFIDDSIINIWWYGREFISNDNIDFFIEDIKSTLIHEYGHNLSSYFYKKYKNQKTYSTSQKIEHWKNYIKKIFKVNKTTQEFLQSKIENPISNWKDISRWYPQLYKNFEYSNIDLVTDFNMITDKNYYFIPSELLTRIPSNYFYKTQKGYKSAFNLFLKNKDRFLYDNPLNSFSFDVNDSLFNVDNQQESIINNELFLDEVIGARGKPKITKVDLEIRDKDHRALRFEGFDIEPTWDRIEISENGISESAKIVREDIAFGFNRRPFPDEYDYKYVANLARVCYQPEHDFTQNAKVTIYDKDNNIVDSTLYDVVDLISRN